MNDLAVTGVTGGVGGRVAALLNREGIEPRLIARQPDAVPPDLRGEVMPGDYADVAGITAALAGVRTLFLVSGREAEDRLHHHRNAVDAAVAAGVERIVYTSFLGASPDATFVLARQHFATEGFIRQSGMGFVLLRDSMYTDFIPYLAGDDAVIRGPAGDGAVSWVTRDDIAEVAARLMVTDEWDGQTLDVTGPEAVTMAATVARLNRFTDRTVSYVDETEEEAYSSRAVYGAPDWEVEGWVTSYQAIATGELAMVGDAVARVTGRPAQTIEDFLAAHPESYARFTGR